MTPADSARRLSKLTGVDRHDAAVVLGSGWKAAADAIGAQDGSRAPTRSEVFGGRSGGGTATALPPDEARSWSLMR